MKAPIMLVMFLALCLSGCKEKDIKGVIIDKYHTPCHTSLFYSGKVLIPITHPANYKVAIANDTAQSTLGVSDYTYFNVNVGDSAKTIDGKLIIRVFSWMYLFFDSVNDIHYSYFQLVI